MPHVILYMVSMEMYLFAELFPFVIFSIEIMSTYNFDIPDNFAKLGTNIKHDRTNQRLRTVTSLDVNRVGGIMQCLQRFY